MFLGWVMVASVSALAAVLTLATVRFAQIIHDERTQTASVP